MFGGIAINLSEIARAQHIDCSYLSRIFSGDRRPGLDHAVKIAEALGMGLEAFLAALAIRVGEIKAARIAADNEHRKQPRTHSTPTEMAVRLAS